MALGTVEKLAEALERARYVIAIEMLVAAQAIDLRALAPERMGVGVCAAYRAIRGVVPVLDGDRPLGPDVDTLAARIAAGDFAR